MDAIVSDRYQHLVQCASSAVLHEHTLRALAATEEVHDRMPQKHVQNTSLFCAYPGLSFRLPWIELGDFPTPVQKLSSIGEAYAMPHFFIKRDDLTGKKLHNGKRAYGGNKLRKLQFLLADALACGAKTVLTFGYAGSNHVVATAAYAQQLGLTCIGMLKPQEPNEFVRKNIALMSVYNCQMQMCPDHAVRELCAIAACVRHQQDYGDFPYCIPTGGSNALGAVGYVDAVFELKQQINKGDLPEPDYMYVAGGSLGTTAGLLLGMHLAGLKTEIVSVMVEPVVHETVLEDIQKLYRATNQLLHERDAMIPLVPGDISRLRLVTACAGSGYGIPTDEGYAACAAMQQHENITLDTTYTAKAFAGLLCDVAQHALHDKTILFWNTYCAEPCTQELEQFDYHQLPHALQAYFE